MPKQKQTRSLKREAPTFYELIKITLSSEYRVILLHPFSYINVGGMCMKKVFFAFLAVIFITVIIPLVIVEFVPPFHNAGSTAPQQSADTEAAR